MVKVEPLGFQAWVGAVVVVQGVEVGRLAAGREAWVAGKVGEEGAVAAAEGRTGRQAGEAGEGGHCCRERWWGTGGLEAGWVAVGGRGRRAGRAL